MDFSILFHELIPYLLGGSLVGIITIPQIVKGKKLENESLALEILKQTLAEVRAESAAKDVKLAEKDSRIDELTEKQESSATKYEDKCEESATAKSMMCIHLGCILRDPILGQGDNFLQLNKDNISHTVDYLTVEELMRKYKEKNKDTESDDVKE